uniref:Uncharacterized protein n=1 Tax=Bombyx mori TaxID=7091 RepID=A0A8R2QTN2_BOMMO|nr:uncharacterized protein LOC119628653 [Bombyx mori]
MGNTKISFTTTLVFVIGAIMAQEYLEELRKSYYGNHHKEIPKHLEIRGDRALAQFDRNIKEIEKLAKKDNVSLIYKVKIETIKPFLQHSLKKGMYKKGKSKKYNVPLKKASMKLSNFEMFLRKMAEETSRRSHKYEITIMTTEKQKVMSPKQILLKYKPIIQRVKTNFTKIIKPVRNREIVLTL